MESSPSFSFSLLHIPHPVFWQVLLEWEGEGGEGKGRREWVKLSDSSKCQALYVESKLLWAKRIITAEQQRRAVAWPSKVSHFLSLSSLSPLALPSFFAFSSLSSSPTFSPS